MATGNYEDDVDRRALLPQVKSWLGERGLGEHSDAVLTAFERAMYPAESWIDELEALARDDELDEFCSAVSSMAQGGSSETTARCMFDFDKEDPQDLGLKQGDVVVVLSQGETWWSGYRVADGSKTVGEFPSSYVELLKTYPGLAPTNSRPDGSMALLLPEGSLAFHRAEVRDWLRDRDLQNNHKLILDAFGRADYPEREWVNELKALERSSELMAFVAALGGRRSLGRAITMPAAALQSMVPDSPTPTADSEGDSGSEASNEGVAEGVPPVDALAEAVKAEKTKEVADKAAEEKRLQAEQAAAAKQRLDDMEKSMAEMEAKSKVDTEAAVAKLVEVEKNAEEEKLKTEKESAARAAKQAESAAKEAQAAAIAALPVSVTLVVAITEFAAEQDDDLGFANGDRIVVTDKSQEWWRGYRLVHPDVTGMFPSNYVKPDPYAKPSVDIWEMKAMVASAVQTLKEAAIAEMSTKKFVDANDERLEAIGGACELYSEGIGQLDTAIGSGAFTGPTLKKLEAKRSMIHASFSGLELQYQKVEAELAMAQMADATPRTAEALQRVVAASGDDQLGLDGIKAESDSASEEVTPTPPLRLTSLII